MYIFCVSNYLLESIERPFTAPGLRIDFSKHYLYYLLNGLFIMGGICGMLERKIYLSMDMGLIFVAQLFDRCTGFL